MSIILGQFLPREKVPDWISAAVKGPAALRLRAAMDREFNVAATAADQALLEKLSREKFIRPQHVAAAARDGGMIAKRLMQTATFVQALFAGIVSTEFGPSPSGIPVPPEFVFGPPSLARPVVREVYVRAEGALSEWENYREEAARGFERGIRFQMETNPGYVARLRALGYDPAKISFRMIYGSVGEGPAVDPDLQCLFGQISPQVLENL